jgi:hypothetical protein
MKVKVFLDLAPELSEIRHTDADHFNFVDRWEPTRYQAESLDKHKEVINCAPADYPIGASGSEDRILKQQKAPVRGRAYGYVANLYVSNCPLAATLSVFESIAATSVSDIGLKLRTALSA